MGYTTDFYGTFKLNKKLDEETHTFLKRFNETRRMKFNLGPEFGLNGEFYVGHHQDFTGKYAGQVERDFPGLVEYNTPPCTQPGLWCQWRPSDDGMEIEWDGGEKFYDYNIWLKYIIKNFLQPKGYVLNGEVQWEGEDRGDSGIIFVKDNMVNPVSKEDEIAKLKAENLMLKNLIPDAILLADEE